MFWANMGSEFHAFIEWCGVLREYLNIVQDLGLDPATLNVHSRADAVVEEFRLEYLGEKLGCILSPLLRTASPRARERFVQKLFGEDDA